MGAKCVLAALALAGCGTAAAVHPAPTRTATASPAVPACAPRMRLADPSLTPAQVSDLCSGSPIPEVTARPVVTVSQPAGPPTPDINGATWSVTVDCPPQQCTALPQAGPGESTCGAIVNGAQVCAGYGEANYQAA